MIFSANEIALFHALSYSWNTARRPAVIEQWAEVTARNSGMERHAMARARNKLVQAGVLFFEKTGNRSAPRYSFNALFELDSPFSGTTYGTENAVTRPLTARNLPVNRTSKQEEEKEKEKTPNPYGEFLGEGTENSIPKQENQEPPRKVLPSGWERWPLRKQKQERVLANNKLMIRIGKWFNQREGTLWNVANAGALFKANPHPDDVEVLESFYQAADVGENDYRRRSIEVLVNNWDGEVNKANLWKAENS